MKAYTKRDECTFDYPDEMAKILEYLEAHGTLHDSARTVQSLYRDYSCERWSAGWIGVNDEILEEFADYLAEIDI